MIIQKRIRASGYVDDCTPHAQRILSLVIRTIYGLFEKSIPSPDKGITRNAPFHTPELLFVAALHLHTSNAYRFLFSSGIPNIAASVESFVWDRYRFLLETMAAVESQKVFDVPFRQQLQYVEERSDLAAWHNILLHLIDAGDYYEWACEDSPGRGKVDGIQIDTRHLILSTLADCACCPCPPTDIGMALSPEVSIYTALRFLKRFPGQLEFTERHVLRVVYTNEGFKVDLLARQGGFSHLASSSPEDQLEPRLFTPCATPVFLESELTRFLHIINEAQGERERHLQGFFESNSHFLRALGLAGYSPQVQLMTSDPENKGTDAALRVDFLGRMIAGASPAIIELKRGMERSLAGPDYRRRHAAQLNAALRQLEEYHNFFEDQHNRRWFTQRYGEDIFRPELILLIGQESIRELAWGGLLKTPITGVPVRVVTYQDILNVIRMQHLVLPSAGYNLE